MSDSDDDQWAYLQQHAPRVWQAMEEFRANPDGQIADSLTAITKAMADLEARIRRLERTTHQRDLPGGVKRGGLAGIE